MHFLRKNGIVVVPLKKHTQHKQILKNEKTQSDFLNISCIKRFLRSFLILRGYVKQKVVYLLIKNDRDDL